MIASSIFSLVVPALDYVDELKLGPIIISVSLLMGALLLFGISKINLNSSPHPFLKLYDRADECIYPEAAVCLLSKLW